MPVEYTELDEDPPGGDKGRYGFRVTGKNGETLAVGEHYVNAQDRDDAIRLIAIECAVDIVKFHDSLEAGKIVAAIGDAMVEVYG
jgi:uncharacterized protein YegP (UPF0339 family)